MISEAGVVAMVDERWGEVPCAFITLQPSSSKAVVAVSEDELIKWCRLRMAGFQTPKRIIVLRDMPKTATAKINKVLLRKWLVTDEWKEK